MKLIGKRRVPNPLISLSGKVINSINKWESIRQPEIYHLFEEIIYGKSSVKRPKSLKFDIFDYDASAMKGKATRKMINISYEGKGGSGSFQLLLFIPNNIKKPVPTFLFINNRGYATMDPYRRKKSDFWPVEKLIKKGYAAATFQVSEIAPDDAKNPYHNSVQKIFDENIKERSANAWGTIAAWAWGASRAMDYLETDDDIDKDQVAIVGHSRGGKTALWTGATDKRFSYIISNNSGCTGAAISRGKIGETIQQINDKFPHWFNKNYKQYNGREEDLPIDQHLLISLLAPRSVYVASASYDDWADPKSEFKSLLYAKDVYHLYGRKGLQSDVFPQVNAPIFGDGMGYHLREGDHDLTTYDWLQFIRFWEEST